jgi:hypothetical protein
MTNIEQFKMISSDMEAGKRVSLEAEAWMHMMYHAWTSKPELKDADFMSYSEDTVNKLRSAWDWTWDHAISIWNAIKSFLQYLWKKIKMAFSWSKEKVNEFTSKAKSSPVAATAAA